MSIEIQAFVRSFEKPLNALSLDPVMMIDVSATIGQAVKLMQDKKLSSIIVVAKDKKLMGLVTERDVLTKVAGKICDLETYKVTEIMTSEPVTLNARDKVAYAMNNMYLGGYRHVPVVNERNEPVALISIKDIMNFIFSNLPDAVMDAVDTPTVAPGQRPT